MECVLRKFGSYENFEEVTGGSILPKSQVWAAVRKYLQKEGCVGEVREDQRRAPVDQRKHPQDTLTCRSRKKHTIFQSGI